MSSLTNFFENSLMPKINVTTDNVFSTTTNARRIYSSIDGKTEFVIIDSGCCLVGIKSYGGNETYYPLKEISLPLNIEGIVMDLDGTFVNSELFWIEVIKDTFIKTTGATNFTFEKEDFPYISGHTTLEHLEYCLKKYDSLEKMNLAIENYYIVAKERLEKITKKNDAYLIPTKGLDKIITICKKKNIKLGLVTSGCYEKAYPEIISVVKQLGYKKIEQVFDTVVTTGTPISKQVIGSLGEIVAKPHPWLYNEAIHMGMRTNKNIIGFEDSGAGVIALRLAGIPVIGMKKGNIVESGFNDLCEFLVDDMDEAYSKLSVLMG